jgi:PAS domain S-box-containing protein
LREGGLFEVLFEAVAIGVAVETLDGQPLFANAALCSMLGFSEEEFRGKHCVDFSPPEDAKKDWALFEQLRQGSIDNYQLEKRYFRKDGTLIWGRLRVALLKNGANMSPLVVAMVEDITDKRATEETLRRSEANLQLLTSRLIQAQEEEQQRIARELHDDIAQRLSLLVVGLDQLRDSLAAEQNRQSALASELHSKSNEVVADLQNLSRSLHSSRLQYVGLPSALRQLCERVSSQSHILTTVRCAELPANLPSSLELCFYRVAQEAVNNAVKHSRASKMFVELTCSDETILLKIADLGVGFDPLAPHQGIGLTTMRERLRMCGGELLVESTEGKGTTIIAKAKLEKAKGASH